MSNIASNYTNVDHLENYAGFYSEVQITLRDPWMQNCISVDSIISIVSYDWKWFNRVHTILPNNLLDIIPNIYNVKDSSGCIELPE